MTDQDITAAAERLRAFYESKMPGDAELEYADNDIGLDHIVCADAYLAEHPADDDVPVDEEWLNSLPARSFRVSESSGRCVMNTIDLVFYDEKCFVALNSDMGYGIDISVATRGHLRRLCRELGWELKEQTNATT